jgi:hypothetical protein
MLKNYIETLVQSKGGDVNEKWANKMCGWKARQ